MRRGKDKGFSIIVALFVLMLAGAALVLLAHATAALEMETRMALLQARSDNLLASARAWAQVNQGRPVEDKALSAEGLAVPDASLTVTVTGEGDSRLLCVRAVCSRGRLPFTRTVTESCPAYPPGPVASP